jgi:hypothetical protein
MADTEAKTPRGKLIHSPLDIKYMYVARIGYIYVSSLHPEVCSAEMCYIRICTGQVIGHETAKNIHPLHYCC